MLRLRHGIHLVEVVLVATLAASSLAGCGPSSQTTISWSRTTKPESLQHVEVFLSIPAAGFDRGIYHGFRRAMESKLATCGIRSKIFMGPPPERGDDRGGDIAPPQELQPDARLAISAKGGDLHHVEYVDQYGNSRGQDFKEMRLSFWIELLDYKRDKVTWEAAASLEVKKQGSSAGEEFASSIISRLRSDGVLKGCR